MDMALKVDNIGIIVDGVSGCTVKGNVVIGREIIDTTYEEVKPKELDHGNQPAGIRDNPTDARGSRHGETDS